MGNVTWGYDEPLADRIAGCWNTAIGDHAGAGLKIGNRCLFLGRNAGADAADGDDLIIVGDEIRSLPEGQTVAFGDRLFGSQIDCDGLQAGDPKAWARVVALAAQAITRGRW